MTLHLRRMWLIIVLFSLSLTGVMASSLLDSLILVNREKHPDSLVGKAATNRISIYSRASDFMKAREIAREAMLYFKNKGDEILSGVFKEQYASLLVKDDQFDRALPFALDAKMTFQKGRDTFQLAKTHVSLGLIYWHLGKKARAYKSFEEAQQLSKISANYESHLEAVLNLGLLKFEDRAYDSCLAYFLDYFRIAEARGDREKTARIRYNIALTYEKLKDYQKALSYLFESADHYQLEGKHDALLQIYNGISGIYLERNLLDSVRYFLDHAAQLEIKEVAKRDLIDLYTLYAELYTKEGNAEQALEHFQYAIEIADKINALDYLNKLHVSVSRIYAQMNQMGQAYKYMRLAVAFNDSLYRVSDVNEIGKFDLALQSKHQEIAMERHRAELLHKDKELLEKDKALTRSYMIMLGIVLFGLFGVAGVLAYRNRSIIREREILAGQNEIIKRKTKDLANYKNELELFSYITSHDLREPLRNISSFASLIERRYRAILDEEGLDYIKYINRGIHQMNTLINDLMLYTEARKRHKMAEQVNTEELVSDLIEHAVEEHGVIEITLRDLPVVVADKYRLKKVFENLLSNAIKYTDPATRKIEIKGMEKQEEYIFCVTDNGIGIPKQYHDQIFNLFKRLHNRDEYDGSGMGLSLCKKIIEEHYDGKIWVQSEVNKGTSMYFSIRKRELPSAVNAGLSLAEV